MKFRKILPYVFVFISSFIITPFAITSFVKYAHIKAQEYTEDFNPATSKLKDGIYKGHFRFFLITFSKVEFEIETGKVKSIDFKKMFHSPGSLYKKDIEFQIKRRKLLEVDAITGATRTSNFAKAAIKDATENNPF